ncbi:unnamed protein product [Cyprideis torosa]|uniref:Uncharacterized protein n=1 Tax=Cyprideis torosa TaxID=163714 RepID=A0A7R8ZUQ9_9CRUS|nr:unnamed protein product [Cyprideis torosa]CAG0901263.1 unnamed protein product [Cyprideis torosa]
MPWGTSLDRWALIGESPVGHRPIEEENSPDGVPQCTNFLQLPLAALLPLPELSPFSWITWHLSHCGVAAICRYLRQPPPKADGCQFQRSSAFVLFSTNHTGAGWLWDVLASVSARLFRSC